MINGKSVLITGGTGSLGRSLVATILKKYPGIRRLVIYSRDELKQYEMAKSFPVSRFPALRYFLGDVRDATRLRRAVEGVDFIIHAAAMKQVPTAEYNPFECIKTNVMGAQNLIEACLDAGVKKIVSLSTDKAAAPVNLYGATKLCSDKLFIAANNIAGGRDIAFSVVRYGNVMGSRGSVIPFFLEKRLEGVIPITDPSMTRFNITLLQGTELVLWALENAEGGEIIIPKIPSYRILDLAEAVAPNCKIEIVGIRPGEKIHEVMVTESDSLNTIDLGPHLTILSPGYNTTIEDYCLRHNGTKVPIGFSYNSGTNPHFLSVEQLRQLIDFHLPAF